MRKTTSTPLISVITVTLNSMPYLRQCIESVLASDFDDFEYVIIDGGSTDGTVEVIREFEDSIAYWHSKRDRGLAHAFNEGVLHSRGRWIQFLNSDDYLAGPGVLSQMADELRARPEADVVFGQITVVSRTGDPVRLSGPHGSPFEWREFLRGDTIPHQAAFTSRDFFARVGPFDESFRIAVDYEHYLRGGSDMRCEHVPILVAHQRDGGLSRRSVRKSLREWAVAQVGSGGRNPYVAWASYHWLAARSSLGRLVRSLHRVIGSGR